MASLENFSPEIQRGFNDGFRTITQRFLNFFSSGSFTVATQNNEDFPDKEKENYYTELITLMDKRRNNIKNLIDFDESGDLNLTYDYVPDRTLYYRLHEKNIPSLFWNQLWTIAIGIAQGLDYLHKYKEQTCVHGNISSKNILLDSNLEPKISGFGIKMKEDCNETVEELSTKDDIYSYGALLYEMATGSCMESNNDLSLEPLKYHFSRYIKDEHKTLNSSNDSQGTFLHFIIMARKCCNINPQLRPEMHEVIAELQTRCSGGPILHKVGYPEIKYATKTFKTKLGAGMFSNVFKGNWKNKAVAIKFFKKDVKRSNYPLGTETFFTEIAALSTLNHENVVKLLGYNLDKNPRLIYEYVGNGTLYDKIHNLSVRPLSWKQRVHIAIGIAKGLEYLHGINERPLIHGDLKSLNVLLDHNLEPKIVDFGLAKEGLRGKVGNCRELSVSFPKQSRKNNFSSEEVDFKRYGRIMYEIATGLLPYDEKRSHTFLHDYVQQECFASVQSRLKLMDFRVESTTGVENEVFLELFNVGEKCLKAEELGLTFTDIIKDLQVNFSSLENEKNVNK